MNYAADVQGRLNSSLSIIFLGHYEYLDKSVLEGKAEQAPNRRSSFMDAQAADSPVTPAPGDDVSGASQVVNAGDFVRPADESEAPPCGRTRRSRSSVQSVKREKHKKKCQSQCTSADHGCQHLSGYSDGRCLVDVLQQLEASGICLLYLESRFPFVCACGLGL